jgi:hypothetical protein
MRPRPAVATLLLSSYLGAAVAHAGDASGPRTFVTLDRVGGDSRAAVDVAVLALDATPERDAVELLRFDLYGRWPIWKGMALGFSFPLTGSLEADLRRGGLSDGLRFGNLGLDLLHRFGLGPGSLFLRAGVAVPTGQSDRDGHDLASLGRATDLPASVAGATAIRLGLTPQLEHGRLLFRADLGLDVSLAGSERDAETSTWAHANLGIGTGVGPIDLTAELTNLLYLGGDRREEPVSLSTLAVAARMPHLAWQPHLALVLPADGDARRALDLAIVVGLQAPVDRW